MSETVLPSVVGPGVSVREFLEAAAARRPTPGGGAVAALSGALATSMLEMVLNYSIGKKDLAAFEGELKPALQKAQTARKLLEQLVEEDQTAYLAMTALRKLPKDDPQRVAEWGGMVEACVRAPQAIAATSVAVLELCDHVVNFVNPYLLSDLAVAADLAMTSARCGVYNVRVNLAEVSDGEARRQIEASLHALLGRGSKVIQRVIPRIWDRAGVGGN